MFAASGAGAESAKKAPARLPTLTTAHQAHSLSSEEARRAYPIHLRAVITYYDPSYASETASIFVHDATGGIYVALPASMVGKLPAGTLIDVRGVSGPGGYAPMVAHARVKVIGQSHLPSNPHRVSLSRLSTGAEDCQWVEAEGMIRSVVDQGHNVRLRLAMQGGIVPVVMVKKAGVAYSSLVNAVARIRAVAAPMFNTSSQMIGVRLMCPDIGEVIVLKAAPGDPFQQPVIPVDNLLRWDLVNRSNDRVHLRGKVTLQWLGRNSLLCIRDAARGICAHTDQDTQAAIGDEVDVVGFAGTEGGAPVLTDAVFRKTGKRGDIPAEQVTIEQVLLGKYDSELIQIDGQLIGYGQSTPDITLLLASGKNIFTVILPKSQAGSAMNAWKVGSRLRVTGICSIQFDTKGSAATEGIADEESFRVLMRSPGDAAVLERPSWWTVGHALALLALAMLLTLLVLGWVAALRKQVEQQTVQLRESEQRFRHLALHDPLTGLATRLLLQDRLNAAVETANRHLTGLALLMLDLDRYKDINDRYGHQAGDEVLRVTALRLLEAVRKSDTVSRMGGDEFLVLLPDLSDLQAAEKIAAGIVDALAVPIHFNGLEMPISVSVGVCSAPVGQLDAEALLKGADAALYHAKASGRNCYQVYTDEMVDVLVMNAS